MAAKQKKFIIIDGNALLHRAWHALPATITTKKGEVVNAVYGFTTILFKVLKDLQPDYLAVTFDLAGPTFRHEQYKEYKANRAKQPDELYSQLPRIKEVVSAFDIPIYEKQGFEADDVIATLVRQKDVEQIKSIIVTGDMDTLQLVDKNTEVYTMHKGISDTLTYDVAEVKRRFDGLTPEQMVDYKALRGDPSDNVPGVKGIGEKGAIGLLKTFKTLENIYKNLDSPKITDRYRELLKEYKADAFLSQKLCQMVDTVPIKFKLTDAIRDGYDVNRVLSLLQQLEFKSLITKLPKEKGVPQQSTLGFISQDKGPKKSKADYQLVNTEKDFGDFLAALKKQKRFAFDTETAGLDPFTDELLGVSWCWRDGHAFYLVAKSAWLKKVKPILEDPSVQKIGHNLKFDIEALGSAGITVQGLFFDTMIASYLTNPGSRQHGLDSLAFGELGYRMEPITDLIGSGKNQITLRDVPLERVSNYSCEDADFTWRLYDLLRKQLEEKNNLGLLEKIEVPLIPVLAEMERNGILIDTDFLKTMSKTVSSRLATIEEKIYELAGTKFNIASPLQLKAILFEKLNISTKGIGHTKTGISTAAEQLDKLRGEHQIIDQIMEFRELSKLKSTYLDALPKLVGKHDGRVHTSFNQTVAATGRLSSSEPNLQNIPVRTELGQKIRQAFVAPRGFQLLSADYSQIELRIIASLANDQKMIESFKKGEDIHARTAAEINDVPLEKVTKQMRYAAKAINFGIIYGQGSVGLSQTADISRTDARDFIDRYFLVHQSIAKFLEQTKALAHDKGYVETWFGRRRYLPEINSSNPPVRAAAERMAVNHPIQGTAADLLKLAMIEIHKKLAAVSPKTKMLLQVHDELVFEVPANDVAKVSKLVQTEMEAVYQLRAPVETHLSVGKNWGALKPL